MGKGNKQTTTSSSTATNTIDPTVQAQTYKNINDANTTAAGWTPAQVAGPAGFTPDQLAAMEAARQAGTAGQGATTAGMNAAQRAAGYTPQSVTGSTYNATGNNGPTGYQAQNYQGPSGYAAQGYGAQGYQAQGADAQGYNASLAQNAQGYDAASTQAAQLNRGNIRDISAQSTADQLPGYLSKFDPSYQQNVIDSTMNDLNRARVMTMQGNDAAAARAGAFGSRRDLLDAETNRGFADAAARTSADLHNQGFTQALSSLSGDQQRQLAAQSANQGADTSVYGSNAQLQNTANLANLDSTNQARAYGATANNQFALSNQAAQNSASQFGAQAANQASLSNAQATNEARQFGAASQNQAGQFNANANNTAGQFNAGLGANIGLANQAAQNTAGQFNAGQAVQNGQFNANAANQAGQFNAGQNQQASLSNQQAGLAGNAQTLAAGSTLAGIGAQQQGMAFNNAQGLANIGGQQQAQNQAVIDNQNLNAQNSANAGINRLGIQQSGMNGAVYGSTQTNNGTQTQVTQPSLMSQIGGGLSLAAGLAGPLTGAFKGITNAINPMSGSLGITSDRRLKRNVATIADPLDKVRRMRGVNYDWKGGGADSGLLAQDVARAAPRAAMDMGGGVKGYNPAPVLGLLVEAVKGLDKKVSGGGGLRINKRRAA